MPKVGPERSQIGFWPGAGLLEEKKGKRKNRFESTVYFSVYLRTVVGGEASGAHAGAVGRGQAAEGVCVLRR